MTEKKEKPMILHTFALPKELLDKIKALAKKERRSISATIRIVLDDFINKKTR